MQVYRQHEWRDTQALDSCLDTVNGAGEFGVDTANGAGEFGVASSRHSHWRLGLSNMLDGTGEAGYASDCFRVAVQGVAVQVGVGWSRQHCLRDELISANGIGDIATLYMMNSVITILYFNGRVYEETDGVIFEGSKKAIQIKRGISFNALKKIGDKVKLEDNEIIFAISCRFLVFEKYVALQICDDEDVETMLESFQQQNQMSILELYIEKDVAGGSMFHSANSLKSCKNNLSNNEAQPPTNVSNLHGDEDDDDYLVSNSYVEESLDEDDSVDGISDTDNEVTDMIQPVRIVHPTEGVQRIENPFWNDALHCNNIKWSHPDEEDICGLEMPSSFNVGQELYVGMDFDTKDAVKNALKQYVMKVHQTFKVVESKLNKYIVCCLNKSAECPCPFYMREILSKKTDSWKVTQWGWTTHMSQYDHDTRSREA
ncbi:hypothetical protein HKD37_16G045074 [Glycine soja]